MIVGLHSEHLVLGQMSTGCSDRIQGDNCQAIMGCGVPMGTGVGTGAYERYAVGKAR